MYVVIHHISGEEFVAQVENDQIVDACGPLHHSEIDTALTGDFDGESELTDELNKWIETGAAWTK